MLSTLLAEAGKRRCCSLSVAAGGSLPLTDCSAAVALHAAACSACLPSPPGRDVVIPRGEVIDRRYRMTRDGKAVYVG